MPGIILKIWRLRDARALLWRGTASRGGFKGGYEEVNSSSSSFSINNIVNAIFQMEGVKGRGGKGGRGATTSLWTNWSSAWQILEGTLGCPEAHRHWLNISKSCKNVSILQIYLYSTHPFEYFSFHIIQNYSCFWKGKWTPAQHICFILNMKQKN